ncbi:hypothetical protein V1507DRAFT_456419 [Lipomyces tetrasporus]
MIGFLCLSVQVNVLAARFRGNSDSKYSKLRAYCTRLIPCLPASTSPDLGSSLLGFPISRQTIMGPRPNTGIAFLSLFLSAPLVSCRAFFSIMLFQYVQFTATRVKYRARMSR